MQICAIVENNSIDRYNRAISKCQSKWVHTSCHGFWPPSSPLLSLATSIPFQVDWTSKFKTTLFKTILEYYLYNINIRIKK